MNIPQMFKVITQLKLHKLESDKSISILESDIFKIKSKNMKHESDIAKLNSDVEKLKKEK